MNIRYVIIVLVFGLMFDPSFAKEDDKPKDAEFVLFRIKKEYDFPKKEPKNLVEDIRNLARKRKFDWGNVIFHSSGIGIKDAYFIIRGDNSEQMKMLTADFIQIVQEYVGEHSVVIKDIQNVVFIGASDIKGESKDNKQ